MKKFIPFFAITFFFAACNSNPSETETRTIQGTQPATPGVDTTGLAQFQQWKAQNELAAATPVQQEQAPVAQAPVKTVNVVREVRTQQSAPARRTTARQKQQPAQQLPAPAETRSTENTTAGNGDVATNTGSGAGSGTTDAPEAAKKEGMSNAKKGAVIGSAGGAVIGAVINKRNRAVGAVIGGVIGGAAGYGLGKKRDSKDSLQRQ